MQVTIKSFIGIGKDKSDDYVIFNEHAINNGEGEFSEELKVIGICDGVGGNAGGKMASGFVVDKIRSADIYPKTKQDMFSWFDQINEDLLSYANQDNSVNNMATTFSGLIQSEATLFLVHVGNTRVYRRQGMFLKQMTVDQTMYQLLVDRGAYEDAEICNKHEIYACLGGGSMDYIQPLFVNDIDVLQKDECLLITSDGIHDYVPIEKLEELLTNNSNTDEDRLNDIVLLARENGSTDDCSIVLIRV